MDGQQKKKGNYLGTEIDNKWFKRYMKDGMLARGNGSFWLDAGGINFHRLLTRKPLRIKWEEIEDTCIGNWHAGKWLFGFPILKIYFRRNGLNLSAGFFLDNNRKVMEKFCSDLKSRIAKVSP